ncbi:MAG: fused MFS/spermidine synthase [Anaerolineae bacterium]|nr:fused MFS/spermidine synthase [Gemmatimonadaceae bacterium]
MKILLYVVFILSGAAGLIYESIWSRYLGLFVGHSAYAQIIVLAIFLGGMSVGAFIIGRRSERVREPLIWYAVAELVAGLIGLVFHDVYVGVTRAAYDTLLPPLAGSPALTVAKWAIAGVLILPQSILLGMTFPLMSAGALRRTSGNAGRTLSLLYFANSLGAAIGVLLAGFYLIRISGLPGTLLVAAMINIAVALVTFIGVRVSGMRDASRARRDADAQLRLEGLDTIPPRSDARLEDGALRSTEPLAPIESMLAQPATAPVAIESTHFGISSTTLWRLLLFVSFGTAVASFVYEIAWIRMLSLVLGSATHSFELMLSAFILGLALGAFWVRKRADHFRNPIRALGIVQLCMGVAAVATLPVYLESFTWMARLLSALDSNEVSYQAFTIVRYAFCLAVMLPSTFCAGMTLPLITRTLLVAGRGERAIGAVYGVNTLGSIAGVVLAGLILLPLIGLKPLLIEGAIIDMAFGLVLLRVAAGKSVPARRWVYSAAAISVLAVTLATQGTTFNPNVLASGVYRYGRIPPKGTRSILYYEDGRTASVAAGRTESWIYIATNGKPDASLDSVWFGKPSASRQRKPIGGDESTQALLPLVTLAHASNARSAAVIGQGSGMTSHLLLGNPRLDEVVTIEIEPKMIEGSRRAFYPANRRVFDDPRSRVVIDDAKSFFASGRRRYDVIISEPSNPWVSGVSGLFTVEFYQRVRSYMSEDGVFGQWLHLYEINDDLVMSVLSAIHQSFPSYQIFQTSGGDILIVASNRPALPRPNWSVFDLPQVAADLHHAVPFTAMSLEASRILDRAALAPLLDGWRQPNSDFYPVLDLGAERSRFLAQSATGFAQLYKKRFDIIAPFFNLRRGFSTDTTNPAPQIERIDALATGAMLRDPNASINPQRSDAGLVSSMQNRWRLRSLSQASRPPVDWKLWLNDVVEVEHAIHGGTAGVIDADFYREVTTFAERLGAPPGVKDALRFMRATGEWDFAAASSAADALLPAAMKGESYMDVDDLRDGAVVAKLRMGDPVAARRYFISLARRSGRSPDHLRNRVLVAYMSAASTPPAR